MEFRLMHLYPDLMSLYGSYANLAVLKRRLEEAGHTVRLEILRPGDAPDLAGGDLLYMGAGTENSADAALEALSPFAGALASAAGDGLPVLFAGTAMELLGQSIARADGTVLPGLGLGEFTSVRGDRRLTGDVYGHTDLYPEAVVGFMNKCSLIRGVETPLVTEVSMGWGNEGPETPEGYRRKNVFASALTGPILVKNPRLLEVFTALLCGRRGAETPPPLSGDTWAEKGYAVTEEQLRLRKDKNSR